VALKSGTDEAALARLSRIWPSLLCLALAAACAFAPPVFELPLFGYFAVALLLIGGIGLMPRLAASSFRLLNRMQLRRPRASQSPVLTWRWRGWRTRPARPRSRWAACWPASA
jgi:putative ABC transport system permease protein